MMDNNCKVKAGTLFCFSTGEYFDYCYDGHFLALVDITTELFQSVVDEIKALIATGTVKDYCGNTITLESEDYEIASEIESRFVGTLIRRGAVMAITCTEIHLGSYGRIEIDGVSI